MNRIDIPTMANQLNALAEVFDKKPISEKAAMVWFDTLKDFPTEKVCGVLIGWPKTHTKFPAPAEVWKFINDHSIGERELKAKKDNQEDYSRTFATAKGREILAQIRKMLKKPPISPREHWERNLKRFPPGHIGYEYAKAALGAKAPVERTPGEDDELAA